MTTKTYILREERIDWIRIIFTILAIIAFAIIMIVCLFICTNGDIKIMFGTFFGWFFFFASIIFLVHLINNPLKMVKEKEIELEEKK